MTDQSPREPREPAKERALRCWISVEVKTRLEEYTKANGLKEGFVTEQALAEYLDERGF
jgi:hypothetical protein